MKYFHSTPIDNVNSILKHGLRSSSNQENNYLHDETEGYNTFIADLFEVEWVASFEVDVEGYELLEGPDGPSTIGIAVTIPPERLTLLGFQSSHDEWIPVKKEA